MEEVKRFTAIGEKTRYNIIQLLLKKSYCVKGLAEHFQVTESAISQHLRILKQQGLVENERSGHFQHYKAKRDALRKMGEDLIALSETEPEPCEKDDDCCKEQKK